MQVRTLIIRAPGTNCELETRYTFEIAGSKATIIPLYRILRHPTLVNEFHILVIPGGFSFGDYLGSGTIFALKLQSIKKNIISFLEKKGMVVGICNGFQVLVRAGLLPDWSSCKFNQISLTFNKSNKFEARWVKLKIINKTYDYITKMRKTTIQLPVAHGEGRFVTANSTILTTLYKNKQVLFEYSKTTYPDNPNGSANNIAGIASVDGQVIGLMPHPERFYDKLLSPFSLNKEERDIPDGLLFIKSIVDYVREKI
ncbi:MAG: phosphoribosylformylglycinamidine synthase I [Planctomycetota bacterium]